MLMSLKGCFSICWFLDTSTAFDTDHFEIIGYVDFRFHSPVFSGSFCLWIGWLPKVTTFLASHLKNNSLYLLFSTSNCRQSYVSSRATWTQLRPSLSSFSDISVQYYVTVCWNTFPNSGAVLLKPVVFSFINQLLIHLSETHLKPEILYASVFFFFLAVVLIFFLFSGKIKINLTPVPLNVCMYAHAWACTHTHTHTHTHTVFIKLTYTCWSLLLPLLSSDCITIILVTDTPLWFLFQLGSRLTSLFDQCNSVTTHPTLRDQAYVHI